MKYIRHKDLGFIIFEEHIEHSKMAERLDMIIDDILSAGFVKSFIEDVQLSCYGESLTLHKQSKAIDTGSINIKMY